MRRRDFLGLAAAAPFAVAVVPDPEGESLVVPDGFTVRVVARAGELVEGTDYTWHGFPDGGATFPTSDGGWVYVSNSELPDGAGGVGALRFDAHGEIVDAYSILSGTTQNCAGGATPWGTWLSCEEHGDGQVWECDPLGAAEAIVRPAMGRFEHEAVAVDPAGRALYLTEDHPEGRLYRFTPSRWEDLSAGGLEVAREGDDGAITWLPEGQDGTTYSGGEGIAYFDGRIAFTTKGDQRIRELDLEAQRVRILSEGFVEGPDNVVFSAAGDLFVCEDVDEAQDLVLIEPGRAASSFARLERGNGSELAGVAFDPSGTRLYVSSQRGAGGGITYEVTGPFRPATPASTSTSTASATATLAPRPEPDDDDNDSSALLVVGAVGGGAIVVVGGLVWLRRRRGTPQE